MLSPRSVMALLAVLALSAKVTESAIAAPDVCSAEDVDKGFCLNCKTKAKCVTANLPPKPMGKCTVAGEACAVIAGYAICLPIAKTTCSCAKRSQCDAYDPDSVLICLNGGVTVSTNCSETQKTCVDGACALPATTVSTASPGNVCTGAPDGFAVIKPLCTTAAYCLGGTSVGNADCASGTYFDADNLDCLPLPPVPCAGCGTGVCPDKSDCSKWYICDGGTVLYEETCDEATPVFDIMSKECLATGTCTGNVDCTYGITTTAPTTATSSSSSTATTTVSSSTAPTVPSSTSAMSRPTLCTATNVGQRYPYEGNCKKYRSCRKVSAGKYDYVESTCLGMLVFNAAGGYCDTQKNVPGCAPPL